MKKYIKLNTEKTTIGKDQVEYIGHILSRDGLKMSSKIIESIKNMPDPVDVKVYVTNAILGMVTYTCKFLPNLSSVTEPLRQLIKDSSKPGYCFMFEEQCRIITINSITMIIKISLYCIPLVYNQIILIITEYYVCSFR